MLPPILQHMKTLGHVVFAGADFDLNLFGIRAKADVPNAFNDLLGCAYTVNGEWRVHYWQGTTDPGLFYRQNPMNVKGTAVLVPGQYRGVYKIDGHGQAGYSALCQRNGSVSVYRQRRSETLDLDPSTIDEGSNFGINIHAPSTHPYDHERDLREGSIGRWSAGCQVHAQNRTFLTMMDLARQQIRHNGWETFTYSLILEP